MAFDEQLFLALNFDGGALCDRIMLALSGVAMWLPLYALILWLVWRRAGWRGTLLFLLLMAAAVGLADMVAGIFKHNGPLGGLLQGIEPRWRPMFAPSLEGLDIAPRLAAGPAEALPRSADRSRLLRRLDGTCPRRSRERPLRHRLGTCRHLRNARRTRLHDDPPAVVQPADGVLYRGDLLLAHLPCQALPRRHPLGHTPRHAPRLGGPPRAALPRPEDRPGK